ATVGTPGTYTLTITDNDAAPTVAFTTAAETQNESVGMVTVTAALSAASGLGVAVPYAGGGAGAGGGGDYEVRPPPSVIRDGATTGTAVISVVDDALDEPDETVVLTMGTPTNASAGAPSTYTLTITDNDAAPTVAFTTAAETQPESVGMVTVTARLSAVSAL